ncbi:MAG: NADH-quinone oxidoreductase subunit F [Deltaproteobacteria bacterium]|nr:MAG: NADH-quinone oxidoreductase subunit F [Deltaproteobacteria bacterium]
MEDTSMNKKQENMASILEKVQEAGGLLKGVSGEVASDTGVPEAKVYGASSFFHLLSDPEHKVRVCQGLTCRLAGAKELLEYAKDAGLPATGCSCLAACDQMVPVLKDRQTLPGLSLQDIDRSQGQWEELESERGGAWSSHIGPLEKGPDELANRLHLPVGYEGLSFQKALGLGPEAVLSMLEESGLQGRGGAGFPAAIKWRAICAESEPTRYVVLNADEGEPGTFKDREVLIRRPDTVLEGLAIAAATVGASDVYCYLRGEFDQPWNSLTQAIAEVEQRDLYPGIKFHMHAGHGAYICGEETALLEALEGKRGMPRLRPPYPTSQGLWGKPTLIHNVESIACVPAILERGGAWFRELGRTEPGTKLFSISGHVAKPGVYELPLGVSLDELVEAAGGYVGTLKAFSPGGASSGFLPASERNRPLGFKSLGEVGSMLGSAGVVVLNDTVDMVWAARQQLKFFEVESCGQCAPCRIGSRFLREQVDKFLVDTKDEQSAAHLAQVADVAWQMNEGSICGLGQTAPLPLTSALRWFPEEFEHER